MKNILDKMASRGVEALSDRELLALLTDDEQLAEVVLSAYDGSLARIGDQPEARLRMVGGLGRSWNASPTRSAGSSTSPRRTGLSSVTASVRAG